ncbi:MAG: hypothetical protein PHO30_01070 [Candidatus Omnitrophica bacterium]|nr:hypothetical protein [Candidatus Omnitrophota bacterium]
MGRDQRKEIKLTTGEIRLMIAFIVLLGILVSTNAGRFFLELREARAQKILLRLAYSLETFNLEHASRYYPDSFYPLINRAGSPFKPKDIASGAMRFKKYGYEFIYSPGTVDADGKREGYGVYAVSLSGSARNFVMNEGGTVYYDNGRDPGRVDKQDIPVL